MLLPPLGSAADFRRRQRMAVLGDGLPILPKPEDGEPCVRCGLCCVHRPCWIGRMLFEQEEGECPALHWSAQGSSCGLMDSPQMFMPVQVAIKGAGRVREAAKLLIGAGVGCIPGRGLKGRISDTARRAALKTLGLWKKATERNSNASA
jgi:hypothetical protein